jgi:FkbM family methyltransferase
MLARTLKRITRRAAFEARSFPVRVKEMLLAAVPEEFKYTRGVISMQASLDNLRRNGFYPAAIIDVGAFQGDWSRMVRRIYPNTPIHMLEANPEKEPLLGAAVREIGAAEYHIALLGPEPAASVLYYVRETGSSVLPENTSLPGSTRQLPMNTLDRVLEQGKQLPGPYLLKLDVQGFELEILRGAEHILENSEAVLLEVALIAYNQGAPLFAEVVAFMRAQGFVVYDISGFYRRESDAALYMVDLLFTRESSALRSPKRFWNLEAKFESAPPLSSK